MTSRDRWLAPIKACRNLVADTAAAGVVAFPATEPAFLAVGKQLWKLPGFSTVYRRSIDTLVERLRHRGDVFRSLRIGPYDLQYDVSQFTARSLYFVDVPYEPLTTDWLLARLGPGDTFVDIGANHGYFSMLAARIVGPAGTVAAFEPNPAVLLELDEHVARNGVADRVRVAGLALSESAGDAVPFYPSTMASNSGLSSLVPSALAIEHGLLGGSRITVRTQTYDAWAEANGLGRARGVKIDVEGAEAMVLRGMARTLAERPPSWIVCETSIGSPAHVLLEDAGYRMSRLDCTSETFGNLVFTPAGEPDDGTRDRTR